VGLPPASDAKQSSRDNTTKERKAMTTLAERRCVPCRGDTPPLRAEEVETMIAEVPGWGEVGGKLTRDVKLANFKEALALVNQIGDLAEQEGHHPDISIHSWNHVRIELYTHSIKGLSENDFILAAKINALLPESGGA
jgi:4a-hydroxytetrahydrobiopterin dehydratase